MPPPDFCKSVFINCPFDEEYKKILHPIIYCLVRLGLSPRISSERNDSGELRLDKIWELIRSSKYSIHDLSRCQSTESGEIFRLNMPFELGMDFGCRKSGNTPFDQKVFLVLEEKKYRYLEALSDIAGLDIQYYEGEYEIAIRKVRNWFMEFDDFEPLAPARLKSEYEEFLTWQYERLQNAGFSENDITDYGIKELIDSMTVWLSLILSPNES